MMKCKLGLALVTVVSGSLAAQQTVIGDYDGYNRLTEHQQGPVLSWQTDSSSGHQLKVYLHRRSGSQCEVPALYSEQTQQYLAPVRQTALSPQVDFLEAEVPASALTEHKVLLADCRDADGQRYQVQHKIPALPKISWNTRVSPAGQFIRQPRGYDYHNAIAVQSNLQISNYSTESYCESDSSTGWDQSLKLFHGKTGHGPFQEDVFVTNVTVENHRPVLSQSIVCSNPAGKTRIVRVWELFHESEIRLVHNEVYYY